MHVEDDRVRQAREQVNLRGSELGGRPGVDRVGLFIRRELAAGERHEVAVGVAPHEHDVVKRGEPVEYLRGLRPGGVVAAHHDPFRRPQVRLLKNGVKYRQHAVNIGQDRDAFDHAVILPPSAGAGT